MNRYVFTALTKENQKVKGIIEANDTEELRKIITFHHYYLKKYRLIKPNKVSFIPVVVGRKDIVNFCCNMSLMLKSGMSLIQVIKILQNSCNNMQLVKILKEIEKEMLKGKALYECLSLYPRIFPNMMISMVEIGERSNTLGKVFAHLSDYYSEEKQLISKIINALFYPSLLLGLTIIVVFILSTVVLPMYGEIFHSNNISLPLVTKILLDISGFISNNLFYIIGSVILVCCLAILFIKTKIGKKIISNYLVNGLFISNIMKKIYTYQIANELYLMIDSGMTVLSALEQLINVIKNQFLINKFRIIIDEIKRGQALSKAMESANYFPIMLIELIKMGEVVGNISYGLNNCAKFHFDNLKVFFGKISVLVEPIMIIGIAVMVGGIMMAVFVPMLEVMSTLK